MPDAPKKMRAALLVRVSTDEQDLVHQEEELRELAARRGWPIVEVYREEVSGASRRRPEFQRLQRDAALNRFDVVVFWAIDRFGRTALEVLRVAEELYERGVGIVSFREPAVDTTTAMGRLVLQVGAAFAEFERARLIERTRSGMAGARARGVHLGRRRMKLDPLEVRHVVGKHHGNKSAAARELGCSVDTVERRLADAQRLVEGGTTPDGLLIGVNERDASVPEEPRPSPTEFSPPQKGAGEA